MYGLSRGSAFLRITVYLASISLFYLTWSGGIEIVQPEGPLPTPEPGSSNPNELACSNPVTFGGKQVVVCTGPQLFSFDLQVANGGTTETFSVPLKFCPIKSPENYKPGEPTEEP
jgi:hypothetical protein